MSPFNLMLSKPGSTDFARVFHIVSVSRLLESLVDQVSNDRFFTGATAVSRSQRLRKMLPNRTAARPSTELLKTVLQRAYNFLSLRFEQGDASLNASDEYIFSDPLLKLTRMQAVSVATPCFLPFHAFDSQTASKSLGRDLGNRKRKTAEAPTAKYSHLPGDGDVSIDVDDLLEVDKKVVDGLVTSKQPLLPATYLSAQSPSLSAGNSKYLADRIVLASEPPIKFVSSSSFTVWATILVRSMFNNAYFVGSYYLMLNLYSYLFGQPVVDEDRKVRLLCCLLRLVPEASKHTSNYLFSRYDHGFSDFDEYRYVVLATVVTLACNNAAPQLTILMEPQTLEVRIQAILNETDLLPAVLKFCRSSVVRIQSAEIVTNVEYQCREFLSKPQGKLHGFRAALAFKALYGSVVSYFDDFQIKFLPDLRAALSLLVAVDMGLHGGASYEHLQYASKVGLVYQFLDNLTCSHKRLIDVLHIMVISPREFICLQTAKALQTYLNGIEADHRLPLTCFIKTDGRIEPQVQLAQVEATGLKDTITRPGNTAFQVCTPPAPSTSVGGNSIAGSLVPVSHLSEEAADNGALTVEEHMPSSGSLQASLAANGTASNRALFFPKYADGLRQLLGARSVNTAFLKCTTSIMLTISAARAQNTDLRDLTNMSIRVRKGLISVTRGLCQCLWSDRGMLPENLGFSFFRYMVIIMECQLASNMTQQRYTETISKSDSVNVFCGQNIMRCKDVTREMLLKSSAWRLQKEYVDVIMANSGNIGTSSVQLLQKHSSLAKKYSAEYFCEVSEIIASYLYDCRVETAHWNFEEIACLVCWCDINTVVDYKQLVSDVIDRLDALFRNKIMRPTHALFGAEMPARSDSSNLPGQRPGVHPSFVQTKSAAFGRRVGVGLDASVSTETPYFNDTRELERPRSGVVAATTDSDDVAAGASTNTNCSKQTDATTSADGSCRESPYSQTGQPNASTAEVVSAAALPNSGPRAAASTVAAIIEGGQTLPMLLLARLADIVKFNTDKGYMMLTKGLIRRWHGIPALSCG
jgi:hypothetical protein